MRAYMPIYIATEPKYLRTTPPPPNYLLPTYPYLPTYLATSSGAVYTTYIPPSLRPSIRTHTHTDAKARER